VAAGLADSQQYNYEWPDDVCSPEALFGEVYASSEAYTRDKHKH